MPATPTILLSITKKYPQKYLHKKLNTINSSLSISLLCGTAYINSRSICIAITSVYACMHAVDLNMYMSLSYRLIDNYDISYDHAYMELYNFMSISTL